MFRDQTSHAFLNTYIAPPPHTLIGLLGSCMGLDEKDTESILGAKIKIGCVVLRLRGYLKETVKMVNQKSNSYSSIPRTRKFLIDPLYRIFVGSEDKDIIETIYNSVSFPQFTLYLGISDCLAYVRNISRISDYEKLEFNNTESMICLTEDNLQYNTKINKPNALTIYPEVIVSPTSYDVTDMGRTPVNNKKFLTSLNCSVHFEAPLTGYRIEDKNICLI
ncbi:MAG: CRISPR-associated protein Cas5 [Candidatus Nitrosocosmicus sp.]|nr:CRISPR-associated protein Cas5 [Candidatus Nitrosocosmicus sp.]